MPTRPLLQAPKRQQCRSTHKPARAHGQRAAHSLRQLNVCLPAMPPAAPRMHACRTPQAPRQQYNTPATMVNPKNTNAADDWPPCVRMNDLYIARAVYTRLGNSMTRTLAPRAIGGRFFWNLALTTPTLP